MNRFTNPILMLLPPDLLGPLIVGMLVVAGLAIMFGARAFGRNLAVAAILLPFLVVLVEVLMDEFFAAIPEILIMPVAFAITVIFWAMLGWAFLRLFFNQAVIDNAIGILLADAIRAGARPLIARPFIVIALVIAAYFIWSAT